MHPALDDLLNLHDGRPVAPEVAAHLSGCPACRASLDETVRLRGELRAMPTLRPPHDGWAKVVARIEPPVVVHPAAARWRVAMAGLAASLAMVAVLVLGGRFQPPAGEVVPGSAALASLEQLQGESQRLEAVLQRMGGARVVSATDASEIADLEDGIALLDWQLSQAGPELGAGARRALWAERVALMQDLVLVRAGSSRDGDSI